MIRCQISPTATVPAPGADWLQIRAKDLPARDLYRLVQQALRQPKPVLVNSRLDVALAAGAQGLHLPANSPPPHTFRPLTPKGFLIGVSCHTVDELVAAEAGGADYAFYGPIFAPFSKPGYHPGLGLAALRLACNTVKLPVFALGGITLENAGQCEEAGATGIAGITSFSL